MLRLLLTFLRKKRLMGQFEGLALSESEVDLSVFTKKKSTNKFEEMYIASAGKKGNHSALEAYCARHFNNPSPESPPAVGLDDSPIGQPIIPEDVKGKGLEKASKPVNVAKGANTTLP
ncbi:hypothetical protein Hanom_Chr05g00428701 [Helianthus anomalus]